MYPFSFTPYIFQAVPFSFSQALFFYLYINTCFAVSDYIKLNFIKLTSVFTVIQTKNILTKHNNTPFFNIIQQLTLIIKHLKYFYKIQTYTLSSN